MQNECPECNCLLSKYIDDNFSIMLCWNCGYYESDSPAYQKNPSMFKNIVRNNRQYFLTKFLYRHEIADDFSHEPQNRRRLDRTVNA